MGRVGIDDSFNWTAQVHRGRSDLPDRGFSGARKLLFPARDRQCSLLVRSGAALGSFRDYGRAGASPPGVLAPGAAYAIETSEGLVLVDSGIESDANALKSQLATLGLDWKRLCAVLLTHAHGDHCGGAEHLRTLTGAKVYAGQGDASVLRAGMPREAFFSNFHVPNATCHPTTIDVELKGGESIAFGDVRFRAVATPGHTPGSVCYLMERANLRVLFAGDVISMLLGDEKPRPHMRDPLGIYSAYLVPRYRGDAKTYIASLHELRALPVPDLVLPGHPGSDPTPQSPRLSQARWEAMLDEGICDLKELLTRYEADGANFLDGEPKRLLPELYYLGDFQNAAVYGFFVASKFFLIDAPGGPGLVEFLNTRLRQLGRQPVAPIAVLLTSCGAFETAALKEVVQAYHPQIFRLRPRATGHQGMLSRGNGRAVSRAIARSWLVQDQGDSAQGTWPGTDRL